MVQALYVGLQHVFNHFQAGRSHVGLADGFYFLNSLFGAQDVKFSVDLVEKAHDFVTIVVQELVEVANVAEHDGNLPGVVPQRIFRNVKILHVHGDKLGH